MSNITVDFVRLEMTQIIDLMFKYKLVNIRIFLMSEGMIRNVRI